MAVSALIPGALPFDRRGGFALSSEAMHAAPPDLVARYFDHAATSFPKPAVVARAMQRYIDEVGGTYGRAAYAQAVDASRIVFDARRRLAVLLGTPDAARVAFTLNATFALNLAIQGLVRPGGRVLVSPLEHNSVLRPLGLMQARHGIRVEELPAGRDGRVDPDRIRRGPDVCLAVCQLASNVNGVRQPIPAIQAALRGVPLVVDAAQGVGEIPIDAARDGLDIVALTGHKALLGPTGTGALFVRAGIEVPPLWPGGTGSRSASAEQPEAMPDSLESGTPNVAGIAGLGAALEFVDAHGLFDPAPLARAAIARLAGIPGVDLLAAADPADQGGLFSFNLRGVPPSAVAEALFRDHGLAVRAGLQCAPAAHRRLGTFPEGAVRLSFGRFHDASAVDLVADAVRDVARRL